MNKIIFLILCLSSFSETISLSLEECIRLAQDKSYAGKIAKNNYIAQKNSFKSFKTNFLPNVFFNFRGPGLNRGINELTYIDNEGNSIVSFPEFSNLNSNANVSISQFITTTNTQISLSSGLSRVDNLIQNSVNWQSTPLRLEVTQPIFAFNSLKWENKIQEKRNKFFDKDFVERMEQIAVNTTDRFFEVYNQQISLENAKRNLQVNDSLFQISQGRYEIGKIAENDLLQAELAYQNAKNGLESIELDLARVKSEMLVYLGFSPNEDLVIEPQLNISALRIDTDLAYEKALENRSEFDNFVIQKIQAQRDLERAKINNSLNASISAGFGLNQSIDNDNVVDVYNDLLNQNTLTVNLRVPVFQWSKYKYDYESAMAQSKATLENIELDKKNYELTVRYEVKRFNLLAGQLEASKRAKSISEKRFDVAKNRFFIGKINLNDLYIAQNEKNRAVENYIRTISQYWQAYYNLRFLTHWDFETNKEIFYEF